MNKKEKILNIIIKTMFFLEYFLVLIVTAYFIWYSYIAPLPYFYMHPEGEDTIFALVVIVLFLGIPFLLLMILRLIGLIKVIRKRWYIISVILVGFVYCEGLLMYLNHL